MLWEKVNKNIWIIIYKLLVDTLFLSVVFLFLALIADGLIPGIVSDHISFLKITLIIALNLTVLYAIGNYLKINLKEEKINKKTIPFLGIMVILLVLNSLLKLNIYLAIFILVIVTITFYLLYKNFFLKSSRN